MCIYRRSDHITCRLDRLWPPTWPEFRLVSGSSHSSDNKTALTGLTWLSWPLSLARPRRLWAARARLLWPSSCNLVAQTDKSSNSTRERHQKLKIARFPQNQHKYHSQPPKWRANCAQGLLSKPFRAPMCSQRRPRASILATFLQSFAWLEPWSFTLASGIRESKTTLQAPQIGKFM